MDKLRCRPGDMAFIKRSWNPLLIGRLVLVKTLRADGDWNVCLLGQAAFLPSEDRRKYVVTSRVIAEDNALVPLRGDELPDSSVRGALPSARPHIEGVRALHTTQTEPTEA
ncbi:hypothetical protein [Pandoraea pulmonicola]|uniref:Uncharacterized protein n=1 Tax=Pandoraea pulmonicola TaxID=93221 RepID=A0AAJ4ZD60_PANPU|nr:hypothetical protein [Pandoraea pulmonicola]APD13695.1 hypothetical protein RO07_07770 [Pandoraea pulmonicola]SUA91217.1 Uncharacterised protein [Pandoraea pulmonicola]